MSNQGIKISLILPGLAGGGAEKVMLLLAKGFAEKGFNVDLIVCKATGHLMNSVPEGVNFINLEAKRIVFAFPSLIKFLYGSDTDIIFSSLKPVNILTVLSKKLLFLQAKVGIVEHSTLSERILNAKKIKDKFVIPFLMKWTYKFADQIICVSKGVADDLSATLSLDRSSIEVIYNPVIDNELVEKSNEPITHKWFEQGTPVIIGMGRLIEEKNFPLLIRSFSMVRERIESKLMILGEGEKKAEIKKLISDLKITQDVDLIGFVENPYKYLKNANLFVLSSNVEGLPTALIEAMACGTPVISTDCPSGPREILENGKFGALIKMNSHEELSEKMCECLENTKCVNKQWNSEKYSVDNAVNRYLKIFEKHDY